MAKVHATVASMVEGSGIQFGDDAMLRRFRGIAEVFLRGLRDSAATRTKLIEAKSTGGMAFLGETADVLMTVFEKKAKDFHAFWKEGADFDRARYVAKEIEKYDLPKTDMSARSSTTSTTLPDTGTAKISVIIPHVPQKISMPRETDDDDDREPEVEASAAPAPKNLPIVAESPTPLSPPSPQPPSAAPIASPRATPTMPITDVRREPRLVNPAEELRRLTLQDFRRLAKNPAEAVARIKEKIDVLSDHDFAERAKGKQAWEQSEVNRLYMDMLRETLEGARVADVIRRRQTKQLPALTAEEFTAMTDLGRMLRYE